MTARVCTIEGCDRPVQARGWCFPHYNRWRNHGSPHGGRPVRWARKPEDVWSLVDRGAPDECWLWTGPTKERGYGDMRVVGLLGAHRIAFYVATGIHPRDRFVCHTCDNPPCCNPAHLFLGTATDNARDAVAKRRMSVGELNGSARLTESEVREIRRLASEGREQRAIAAAFGISQTSVWSIHHRRTWRHVA